MVSERVERGAWRKWLIDHLVRRSQQEVGVLLGKGDEKGLLPSVCSSDVVVVDYHACAAEQASSYLVQAR